MTKSNIRDILLSLSMISAALFIYLTPVEKHAPGEKVNLPSFVPETFHEWVSKTYDTADYRDQWQSINELVMRSYFNKLSRRSVNFVLEYNSDLRKNFSFHFPEDCQRSSGNEVVFFDPLEIQLTPHKMLRTKLIYVKGTIRSEFTKDTLIAYWLTMDNKQYYRTFFIKLDQMLSGLLSKHHKGFLVRVDYFHNLTFDETSIDSGKKEITAFIKDLYRAVDKEKRVVLFGEPSS